ncbi:hypothetical protein B0H14DRAFT_3735693 [Mycena olivaceomarginata]|nr:hypothetical protein B0H14DRAFT_3735693 [Mycena olivaceomarginata]
MQSDMDIIITVNPDLAEQVHDASWIMVDTTFPVVHGTMNEWKLLIWPNGLDKSTVIGRVWSNRATREAFVIVWNGIFEAIKLITGKSRNFKVFSKSSSLLGAIGDSEGAQAQGLGDVIILRQMNTSEVNGMPTITVDGILPVIWKTCLVHFKRGVFKLEAYVEEYIFHSLLGFFLTSKLWRKLHCAEEASNGSVELLGAYGNIHNLFFTTFSSEFTAFHLEFCALIICMGQCGQFLTNHREFTNKDYEIKMVRTTGTQMAFSNSPNESFCAASAAARLLGTGTPAASAFQVHLRELNQRRDHLIIRNTYVPSGAALLCKIIPTLGPVTGTLANDTT